MRYIFVILSFIAVALGLRNISALQPSDVNIVCLEKESVLEIREVSETLPLSLPPPSTPKYALICGLKANINLATEGDIGAIDGIGIKLAKKVINYRNSVGVIKEMDELLKINGIGKKRLKILKEYFYAK